MSRIIGIDLGTTNSCVAAIDSSGLPRILSSSDGERTTPSTVAFTDQDTLVGVAALRQAVSNPGRTIMGAKRLIGRKVNSEDVASLMKTAAFKIVAAPNGDVWLRIGDDRKPPQEIASFVLRRMKAIAESALGEPVTRAIITVPSYFDDAQRQATKDAGTIAGLDVIRILNEPTAAALAYGAHRVKEGRRIIAVFDLGGGTFDISIMAVENGIFEVLSTNGDTTLGGEDWDRKLIEHLADRIFDTERVDLAGQAVPMSRLKEAAEKAKRELSTEKQTTVRLPYLAQKANGDAIHIESTITRLEFEALTRELCGRLAEPCKRAIEDAGITPAEIEEVLLVGGMSRSPAVQEMVTTIFGQKPSKGANPDEVVALGAATYAGILAGEQDDTALLDVTPHTIGIRVGDTGFAPIIARNAMLPVREKRTFATSHDDQSYVRVEIYQGEGHEIQHNRKLGQVLLEGLPPGKAGSVRIELTITVDIESILHVAAKELSTGKATQIKIQPSGGLSAQEIVEIVQRRRSEEKVPSRRMSGQR